MIKLNSTHDSSIHSWIESANVDYTHFPIQNLPFGVFSEIGAPENVRCGVAIGDQIVDVAKIDSALTGEAKQVAAAASLNTLNALMQLDSSVLSTFRAQLFNLLSFGNAAGKAFLERHLIAQSKVQMHLPVNVAGYTDFFASIHHATNAGRLFRPDQPLLPNYKYVPVGYNGRAASIQLSGETVQRPKGQLRKVDGEAPVFLPCEKLDYEVELGMFIGQGSKRGNSVGVKDAWNHIFGFGLLNDWSARDIQSWEYQPLGPFLAKSFATSISPWIITAEALAPFRKSVAERSPGDPAPLPHLFDAEDQGFGALSIEIDAQLRTQRMRQENADPVRLSRSNSENLYWSPAQMVSHHTSNGSHLVNGDVMGSGTISGPQDDALGSLLEITRGAKQAFPLPNGEQRKFLEDGDEITLVGRCHRDGYNSIGFGTCCALIVPAN